MKTLTISLTDINSALVAAWRHEFTPYPAVSVTLGSIFDSKAHALVSPANSFGIMDGGLDGKLRDYFGHSVESLVRTQIRTQFFGELPVGMAFAIPTSHIRHPYLICAPTMRVPENVADTLNAYLAMKAILNVGAAYQEIHSIAIPGLCALSGLMPPDQVARQMRIAYERVILGMHDYSHWREEKQFAHYIRGHLPYPPEDLEKPLL